MMLALVGIVDLHFEIHRIQLLKELLMTIDLGLGGCLGFFEFNFSLTNLCQKKKKKIIFKHVNENLHHQRKDLSFTS